MKGIVDYITESERTAFEVIDKVDNNVNFNNLVLTAHWRNDRLERHQKIMDIIGNGTLIASFEVYTAHPNGNEIHNIFDNGIILIQNAITKRLVTELIARPQQIKRYWQNLGLPIPSQVYTITAKAKEHQDNGYNCW